MRISHRVADSNLVHRCRVDLLQSFRRAGRPSHPTPIGPWTFDQFGPSGAPGIGQIGPLDAAQQRIQRGAVERPVVLHPAPHDGIHPPGEVREAGTDAQVETPPADLSTHRHNGARLTAGKNAANIRPYLFRADRVRKV